MTISTLVVSVNNTVEVPGWPSPQKTPVWIVTLRLAQAAPGTGGSGVNLSMTVIYTTIPTFKVGDSVTLTLPS